MIKFFALAYRSGCETSNFIALLNAYYLPLVWSPSRDYGFGRDISLPVSVLRRILILLVQPWMTLKNTV